MARILGGKQGRGAPGWRTRGLIPFVGPGRVTSDSASKRGIRRLFARDPSKGAFVNIGTAKDVLGTIVPAKQASLTTAMAGANNDIVYRSRVSGTVGNSIRVAHVVAGANTPLTVGVSGNDITVNVATNAGSAATSTAAQVIAAVAASAAAMAKLDPPTLAAGNDGSGVVAAFALTNLTGGAQAVGQHEDVPGEVGPQNPTITNSSEIRRRSSPVTLGVRNRATNRRIRRR